MSFKMKIKPLRPVRATITNSEYIGDRLYSSSVKDLVSHLSKFQENAYIKDDGDCDGSQPYIYWEVPESEQEFKKRLAKYEEALENYNIWCEEFKGEIAEHKENRKKKNLANKQKEVDKLKQQIKSLSKKLEEIKNLED